MYEGFAGRTSCIPAGKSFAAPQTATRLWMCFGRSQSLVWRPTVKRSASAAEKGKCLSCPVFHWGAFSPSGFWFRPRQQMLVFFFLFYPHCFSIMDWRARAQFSRSKGHQTALSLSLSLLLAVLTAGPSLTVPQEEMQIYRGVCVWGGRGGLSVHDVNINGLLPS